MDDITGDSLQADPPQAAVGDVVAGRYRLLRTLGRGASKMVYLAHDERLDREVALALVGRGERVTREARVTGRLGDHPNVVTAYDAGELDDGTPYLVLRAMTGGSLADLLRANGPSLAVGVRAARDVAAALDHAHAAGVVHRDVKPDNVWLDGAGSAALGDFGVAHAPGDAPRAGVVGTARYVAPEQIRGAPPSAASDLYGLGVMLYESVAGRAPFTGADAEAIFAQHLEAAPPPLDGVPPLLEALIGRLLAKDPAARPSAAQAREALDALLVAAPPASAGARRVVWAAVVRLDVDDPEALHAALQRCRETLTGHGATTIGAASGDALLAVFGDGASALQAARSLPDAAVGVETGEAFLAGGTSATGTPIGVAARLAAEAQAGTVVLGAAARAAVGDEVQVDGAGRLVAVRTAVPALLRRGSATTPFVGRAPERAVLQAAFARAVAERACVAVTVAGPPGIGKSRLAGEVVARLDATLIATTCEGGRGLDELLARVGAREAAHPQETALALRQGLERLAALRPVVVAVEDLHWAPAAFRDALTHVVELASGPLLVLCLTRPDGGALGQVLQLDPLSGAEARALAAQLGAADAAAVAARAEGNPLFVEQLVAAPPGDPALPLSIHAVLAARIDALDEGERALLQRGAVEGRTFHVPPHTDTTDLVAQDLVAPVPGRSGALRFTHALLRDAAYASLTKRARADLHVALAGRLGDAAPDEVVAGHLERACALRAELGDPPDRDLAARAAGRLHAAAGTALDRGDPPSAADLLARAAALLATADPPARAALLPALGAALFHAGRLHDAEAVLREAAATAPAERLRARARTELGFVQLETGDGRDAQDVAAEARAVLEREGDAEGQARAHALTAQALWTAGQVAEADAAWRQAERLAVATHDRRERFAILGWRATAAVLGPVHTTKAIISVDDMRNTVAGSPVSVVWMLNPLASLHAMRGDFTTARALIEEANATLHQLGSLGASVSHHEALVHLLAGDPQRAAAGLRRGVQTLTAMDDRALLATTAAMLAQALVASGDPDEAEPLCALAANAAADDDLATHALWRSARSSLLTARGPAHHGEALALARQAVTLLAPTDLLSHRADAMLVLADVLRGASRSDEASETARAAHALYELKGNTVGAGRARSLMDAEGG